VIPAYKHSRGMSELENNCMFFNQELSICRVRVEHTIGLLKIDFFALKISKSESKIGSPCNG